jgi:hypothetical protein
MIQVLTKVALGELLLGNLQRGTRTTHGEAEEGAEVEEEGAEETTESTVSAVVEVAVVVTVVGSAVMTSLVMATAVATTTSPHGLQPHWTMKTTCHQPHQGACCGPWGELGRWRKA